MSYKLVVDLLPEKKWALKCPFAMAPQYITVHNTWNDAPATNEISYMKNNDSVVGYHVAVDDIQVIQGIPFTRNAFHCGDGGGTGDPNALKKGNRISIGVEICYSKSGGPKYVKAEENAVQYIATILKSKGWGIDRVKKHQDWSGKYCPHRILDEGRWKSFLNRIQVALDKLNKGVDEVSVEQYNALEKRVAEMEKALSNKADVSSNKDALKDHAKHWQWAKENGITDGSNPQGALSRQHFATMLFRFWDKFVNKK